MQCIQIKISGELTQTGFPFYVKQFAYLNNIKGWVRHSDHTQIIIDAEGEDADINKFIEYCRIGPNGSVISSINISHTEIKKYESFKIIEKQINPIL